MAKCVAAHGFVESGPADRFLNGSLEYRLIEMVAAAFAGHMVPIHAGRGKDPLPAQLACSTSSSPTVGTRRGDIPSGSVIPLTRKSLLLASKSEMLARKSLLLMRKSKMLTRKWLLLTS